MNKEVWIAVLLLVVVVCAPVLTLAARGGLYKVVEGVAIYVKLVPTKALQGQAETDSDNPMHGGVPLGDHVYHVIVDLFDHATGKRITRAEVAVQISDAGTGGLEKGLQPMRIGDHVAYANYFDLRGTGPYQLRLKIRRPGAARLIETELTFEHTRL